MGSELVLQRIEAWRDAGLIDPETARRLAEAEAIEAAEPGMEPARPPGASVTGWAPAPTPGSAPFPGSAVAAQHRGEPIVSATEVFAYLGAGFVLGSWYALVASVAPLERTAWTAIGALLAAAGMVGVALALREHGWRARRAAGITLLVALPNVGAGLALLIDALREPQATLTEWDALVVALAVLVAGVVARRIVPAVTTQLGLAIAAACVGGFALAWAESVLLPGRSSHVEAVVDVPTEVGLVLAQIAWWLLVALGMAVMLVLRDGGTGVEPRRRLGRVAVGLTAVGGTSAAAMSSYPWSAIGVGGEPVLLPWIGALIVLAVSAGLVVLAQARSSLDYLWPAGLGVLGALSYLNGRYLAVSTGLWVALLIEAVVLFAVALGFRTLAGSIQPRHASMATGRGNPAAA